MSKDRSIWSINYKRLNLFSRDLPQEEVYYGHGRFDKDLEWTPVKMGFFLKGDNDPSYHLFDTFSLYMKLDFSQDKYADILSDMQTAQRIEKIISKTRRKKRWETKGRHLDGTVDHTKHYIAFNFPFQDETMLSLRKNVLEIYDTFRPWNKRFDGCMAGNPEYKSDEDKVELEVLEKLIQEGLR
jgi:hypothetical protein